MSAQPVPPPAAPSVASLSPQLRDLSGRRLGRYEVLAQLASGGMATVYVARAQGVAGFERLVAIKVLHPHLAHDEEFISMFLDEARLAARIRHPNVVPTLDISDSQGDGYFLVMEYVEGDHLGALLREAARAGTRVPVPVTLRLLIDALEGLAAAHGLLGPDGKPLGIVHRDVSPHNVLVGSDGVARITDFGVAKAEVRLSSTRDGQFKGKLSYMAPEQASHGVADQRSDLFSMGIVLWESLMGRRLFRAENNGELLNRLLNEPVPPPSALAPELAPLDPIVARVLQRDPAARYASATEMVEALEQVADRVGGIATPRAVGKLVRELLGPKIDGDSARIRGAIESLGRSDVPRSQPVPRPEGGGSQPNAASSGQRTATPSMTPSAVRPIEREEMTMGARPSNVSSEHEAPRRSRAPLLIGVLVLLLLGGVATAWASGIFAPAATVAAIPASNAADVAAPTAIVPPEAPPVIEAPAAEPVAVEATTPERPTTEPAAIEATDEESSAARERRHRRRAREAAEAASGGSGADEDDDLLVNPYRH